jgi:hypothetical protein
VHALHHPVALRVVKVVSTCLMPRLVQAPAHKAEVNCALLSVVTVAGTPASTHVVDLSMMVNGYMWPSEEADRGPTRSTCTWEK